MPGSAGVNRERLGADSPPQERGILIDDSDWPVARSQWPKRNLSDSELDDYLRWASGIARRGELYVFVADARYAKPPSSTQRAMISTHTKLDATHTQRWLAASCVVVPSGPLALMLDALRVVSSPPFPMKNFSDYRQAEAWGREQLNRRRVGLGVK